MPSPLPAPHRLRILYLVPDLFGPPSGIARYCRMVCLALRQEGHDLSVISLLDAPDARGAARRAMPGLKYLACGASRAKFTYRALRALPWLPDVVLVGHPNFAPLGWLLARLARARMIVFIYGIDAWEPLSLCRRKAVRASDAIISISRFTARRAGEVNGMPQSKIRILHNCINPQPQPRGESGPSTTWGVPSLLTVARISLLEQYKGHDYVIRALPQLLAEFPSLLYHIVGDGDGRPALEALARQVKVNDAVRFHGAVPDEELERLYREAWAFVMPSRGEGFGFVFIEAMREGTPAIGGSVDATPEVIVHGETGFVIDPTSVDEIAHAAAQLLGDAAIRERMGQAAVAHVHRQFGFENFARTLQAHLAEVDPLSNLGHSAPVDSSGCSSKGTGGAA